MVLRYSTPGAYYERVDASAPAITAIRSDIAGFVGIARRGPLHTPVPVQSWRQFQAYFGDVTGAGFLAYAVRGFFENGGRRCWCVRVASSEEAGGAATAGLVLYGPSGAPVWRIAAGSPGVWGNDLAVLVRESSAGQTVSIPGDRLGDASRVASTAGFQRGSLARLLQAGREPQWKVVSDVDAVGSRLIWQHDHVEARLPYDSPVDFLPVPNGFDPDLPVQVHSIDYAVLVRERGRQLAQFEGLSLVPEHPAYGARVLAAQEMPSASEAMVPSAPRPIVIEELRDLGALASGITAIEPLQPAARTTLEGIADNRHIRVGSIGGFNAGAAIELLDPLAGNAAAGQPLSVLFIDPVAGDTITLGGDGLSQAQRNAHTAAVAGGSRLAVRALGGAASVLPLAGGADGLARLTVDDYVGEAISPWDNDAERLRKRRGLRALELIDEVAIVAVPDIHIRPAAPAMKAPLPPCEPDPCLPMPLLPAPPRPQAIGDLPPVFSDEEVYRVQAMLVQHCEERRDRIAILDATASASLDGTLGISAVQAWRSRFESKYAALYYPWLRVVDPLRLAGEVVRAVPPSGHVAGQYAHADFEVGVHKAPANAPLVWADDVTTGVDEALHGLLNTAGVNVIKALRSRGLRIMGARTVSSDTDWRFVNVRRLMMVIEKAIDLSTRWVAFEPNDHYTRAKLALSLTSFLLAFWQQGALKGATPAEAFFVRCDETNNPPEERENGRFHVEIGVAPSKPFEFIVLRVGRADNQLEIAEVPGGGGGATWLS
jgi:phage tail sheath protein FI